MLAVDAIDFLAEICKKFMEVRPHLEGHLQDTTTSRLENFANFTPLRLESLILQLCAKRGRSTCNMGFHVEQGNSVYRHSFGSG